MLLSCESLYCFWLLPYSQEDVVAGSSACLIVSRFYFIFFNIHRMLYLTKWQRDLSPLGIKLVILRLLGQYVK